MDTNNFRMALSVLTGLEFSQSTPHIIGGICFAKEAVKKQIPMMVNVKSISKVKALDVENGAVYTYSVVRCPACNKPIILNINRKHCEHCGQALDWREQE